MCLPCPHSLNSVQLRPRPRRSPLPLYARRLLAESRQHARHSQQSMHPSAFPSHPNSRRLFARVQALRYGSWHAELYLWPPLNLRCAVNSAAGLRPRPRALTTSAPAARSKSTLPSSVSVLGMSSLGRVCLALRLETRLPGFIPSYSLLCLADDEGECSQKSSLCS